MATTFKNDTFQDVVLGRKSIRVYDENVKISQEEMLEMIQEATTAPSSVNMQPWRFVVVESPEAKETLKPLIKFNVRQNDTSAAMLLIFGDMECYELGEQIYDQAVAEGKRQNRLEPRRDAVHARRPCARLRHEPDRRFRERPTCGSVRFRQRPLRAGHDSLSRESGRRRLPIGPPRR